MCSPSGRAPLTNMNHLSTMYATKRRRRNSKSVRVPAKEHAQQTKSNPSKRHRERLNAELDTLAGLLPFDQNVLSKLDKLSILRLSVSYLRTKSYFQAALYQQEQERNGQEQQHPMKPRDHIYNELLPEGDLILQALSGFLLILTCDGEVFYTSHTVETYLGFHQSDICHQSVYELVHSEDREELQRHLMWNSQLPADRSALSLQEALSPENTPLLERNFTVRFRCLLDNTSGFLRLDVRGRIKVLHGQNPKTEDPPLALFAVCTPFGPPSLLEMPHKDAMFKSKHKLDLSLVSLDQRAKQVLGYSDSELADKGCYDLVHYDDLAYVASAHQELLKTGASGLIAYRLVTKSGSWQWLQTSARLVYKNSKPDFILSTHRPLMEEEGRDLLGKRTMDFKVTYLDGGLNSLAATDRSGLLSDSDFVMRCQRTRRYKSQIRDIITTCRKRKSPSASSANNNNPVVVTSPTTPDVAYVDEAVYNGVYPFADAGVGAATPTYPQNLFVDNTRFLSAENFLYRPLGSYYPDYTVTQYPTTANGFLDPARTCFATFQPDISKDDKLYQQCQMETARYDSSSSPHRTPNCDGPYLNGGGHHQPTSLLLDHQPSPLEVKTSPLSHHLPSFQDCSGKSPIKPNLNNNNNPSNILMAIRDWHKPEDKAVANFDSRQSVLMWNNNVSTANGGLSVECPGGYDLKRYEVGGGCKWSGHAAAPKSASPHNSTSPASGKVAPQVTYAPYTQDMRIELPLVRCPTSVKQEGNPLLSISEVTNTLLDHH
ncbi:hypothetical protein JTE90_011469 [Oedothorax gibbosus]|uniref:Aryl hydrocarbon receptor n=1 Tax=Oedothorax gibbosus TaxID=931172 RepID=A0AAV6VD45_9ARAC|nr:hypothetical protein JTE90_011469 [Oedothorax gibbosus]